jgi:DinB superfamily
MVTVDPVSSPSEYQRMLLDLLGVDDPAGVQAATPRALRQLVDEAGPDLRTRPAELEWSVLECIGHISDAEIVSSARYRWILSQDEPVLIGYDQDRWVDRLDHLDAEPEELLAPFTALRTANLALWGRTKAADRSRVGMHTERGPESYDLTFRLIAGHDRFHVAQARRAIQSIRASLGADPTADALTEPAAR